MLGHTQIGITLDLYSHVTATMQREAVEAVEELLASIHGRRAEPTLVLSITAESGKYPGRGVGGQP
jgi:hypothetical protein